MHNGFILNYHNREQNPCFESHDPSMMWDSKSGMYYSYSTDTAITSQYKQGIPVRKSRNLVDFTFVGYALSDEAVAEGRDNGENNEPTYGFWAPYVECVNGEYRMYYSATKAFGSSESRIWLAVSDNPEGPFENRGVVMDTWGTSDNEPNAIDAHVCDTPDGQKYLIYGSFFGGIFIKELNPATGMPVDADMHYMGKCIAVKPKDSYIDGPEGPAVIYNPATGYYYLFVSYGWLGDNYDIRVGRSRDITGPYVDIEGKDMFKEGHGCKLAGSYCFNTDSNMLDIKNMLGAQFENARKYTDEKWQFDGFRGPGHGVPFYAPEIDGYFFVHHIRDGAKSLMREEVDRNTYSMHYLVIRRMFFVDGWPVLSPEFYAGEGDIPVAADSYINSDEGREYDAVEYIEFLEKDNNMSYSRVKDISELKDYKTALVFDGYDYEKQCMTKLISGINSRNCAFWGKLTNFRERQ